MVQCGPYQPIVYKSGVLLNGQQFVFMAENKWLTEAFYRCHQNQWSVFSNIFRGSNPLTTERPVGWVHELPFILTATNRSPVRQGWSPRNRRPYEGIMKVPPWSLKVASRPYFFGGEVFYVGLTFRVPMCHFDAWGLFGSLKCFKCSPPLSWRKCVLASFSWANFSFCVESFNRDPDFVNGFWLGFSPPKLNMDPKNDGWNHWNLLLQGAPIFRCYVGIVYRFCAKITQIQPWTHDGTHMMQKKTDSQHRAGRREIHKPFWTQLTSSDCGLRISSKYPFISSKNQHRWESLWRCP